MPTEPNLPTELNEIEAMLHQLTPAGSTLNRDALMYQAGWEAAASQTRNSTHWLWPTTTAALAASLLMLLAYPPASPLQRTGTTQVASPNQPTASPPTPTAQAQPTITYVALPKRYSPTASLLTMRDRALRQEFDNLPGDALKGEGPLPTNTSNRQLLQEFLPELSNPRAQVKERSTLWPRWN